MADTDNSAIPLILGVAGHRNVHPAQIAAVKAAVQNLFAELRERYRHTPLTLLSPLTSDVDRLVAQLAAEPGNRVSLVAVRPWASEYESPRDSQSSATEASTIPATQVIAMPLASNVTREGLASDESARQVQYDQAGRYIARHCQILIAVWDEVDSPESHTAKIVRWFREGAPAPFTVRSRELDVGSGAAIWHLKVRRSGETLATHSNAADSPGTESSSSEVVPAHLRLESRWEYPSLPGHTYFRKPPKKPLLRFFYHVRTGLLAVHRWLHAVSRRPASESTDSGQQLLVRRWQAMNRFNADIALLPAQQPGKLVESANYLFPVKVANTLPDCLQQLRRVYAFADTAAGNCQRTNSRVVLMLFGMALFAVGCLETYAHFVNETWFLAGYLVVLAGAYALFRWTRRAEHQGRWLDYRALAESLRVQIFWRWAGLQDCVADHYLRHFRGELDWIRHGARAAFLASGAHADPMEPTPPLVMPSTNEAEPHDTLAMISRYWVDDQRHFFVAKSPFNSELELAFETAARLAYFGAIAVALFHFVYHLGTQHMSHALVLATFGCLVLAAILEEYADIQAYTLLARRYRWMADLYENAGTVLKKGRAAGNPDQQTTEHVQGVLFELGREALTENADWVVQHRQRPPVLPGG